MREQLTFNWHQHIATQILKKEYDTTEQIFDRARWLDLLEDDAYHYDTERLGWWWRLTFNWITTPGSYEEKRARIKTALQHFSWVCKKLTQPIIAKEQQLPPSQRLAQLSSIVRFKLVAAQQEGVSLSVVACLDQVERVFAGRLCELLEAEGLTQDDRTDCADNLIAAYSKVLRELLNRMPCARCAA
jgi:hypothetical protein